MGLIAKNGILIVEDANSLRAQGFTKLAALRQASLTRLCLMLMTIAATVFGHVPLVFVTGPGAAARRALEVNSMRLSAVITVWKAPIGGSFEQCSARSPGAADTSLKYLA